MLVNKVGNQLAHLGRAGCAIRRDGDGCEYLKLRNHAGWRLDPGYRERRAVWGVTMHRSQHLRLTLHHLQMHEDFAGALSGAGELVAFHVHKAQILRLHEPLGN